MRVCGSITKLVGRATKANYLVKSLPSHTGIIAVTDARARHCAGL